MADGNLWYWVGFNAFVLLMLVLDLGVFHRKSREIKIREALIWTGIWITLALLFNLGIYHFQGKEKALEFLTGYLIEKSLSVDNIFVFILIFSYFNVPVAYQHKVLFWGIIGALVMRAVFIFAGLALIEQFNWVIYIFAAFLVFTGIKIFFRSDKKIRPDKNPVVRLFIKILPVADKLYGNRFFIKLKSKYYATPLFIVVLTVEFTDLVFAVDSIPAILAISSDPFIVYTSNVFAILGLRALYFALAGMHRSFQYLKAGLAFILIFVGIKMFLTDIYHIPIYASLIVISGILATAVIASVVKSKEGKLK